MVVAIGNDAIRLAHDLRFNHAIEIDDWSQSERSRDVNRQFAHAYALQQEQDFKGAVNAYANIVAAPASQLALDIKYNLANLYFREAARLRAAGPDDLSMPLVDLAKQNYLDVLREDSRNWDAKYNLELALILSPELDPADTMEERNPEHSPRALTTLPSREPLP
jgi:mxaK protein